MLAVVGIELPALCVICGIEPPAQKNQVPAAVRHHNFERRMPLEHTVENEPCDCKRRFKWKADEHVYAVHAEAVGARRHCRMHKNDEAQAFDQRKQRLEDRFVERPAAGGARHDKRAETVFVDGALQLIRCLFRLPERQHGDAFHQTFRFVSDALFHCMQCTREVAARCAARP